MSTVTTLDEAKVEAFAGKALGDASGFFATLFAGIGDRLGLFKDLAANGPATSDELAHRTNIDERYVREWLAGVASASYLEYDPANRQFALPPEHVPVLAQEGGPMFLGGAYQEVLGALPIVSYLVEAFRRGGGVPQAAYGEEFWAGMDRFTVVPAENLLIPLILPAVPAAQSKLERGALVADIGCGNARAPIQLARAYPSSRFVGYDVFEPMIARAKAHAAAAGVGNRMRFERRDVAQGLPEQYDVITTFDVVHDAADPFELLRAIRQGLKPDGVYVCLETNCSDRLEENFGPVGTINYGISLIYCMTTSLAGGGEGLGTAGLPESKLRTLCLDAGFSSVRRAPFDHPFFSVYEITA